MKKNLCPEIHYRKTEKGLVVTSCYGVDGEIILPDTIDGTPIIEIAPYAFSDGNESEGVEVFFSEEASLLKERRRLKTLEITEIRLPAGIREIGKYAFYRCRNLRKLVLSDELLEIGGGALTGCRGIREVEIYFRKGEKSALKSILDEVRFAVHARLYMGENVADILIPEHYEEAVEDTPARQLYTQHHGAGGDYRQCFYNRELDYRKYDSLLPRVIAEDTVETVARMALGRLKYPYKLSADARMSYDHYLKKHIEEVVLHLIDQEDMENLKFLSTEKYFTEQALLDGIEFSTQKCQTEITGFLMDEKRKLFPRKKKTFDL